MYAFQGISSNMLTKLNLAGIALYFKEFYEKVMLPKMSEDGIHFFFVNIKNVNKKKIHAKFVYEHVLLPR